jgi:hypothetical protein
MDIQQKVITIANTIDDVGNAVIAFEEFAELFSSEKVSLNKSA